MNMNHCDLNYRQSSHVFWDLQFDFTKNKRLETWFALGRFLTCLSLSHMSYCMQAHRGATWWSADQIRLSLSVQRFITFGFTDFTCEGKKLNCRKPSAFQGFLPLSGIPSFSRSPNACLNGLLPGADKNKDRDKKIPVILTEAM